jgi:hypothetical protein
MLACGMYPIMCKESSATYLCRSVGFKSYDVNSSVMFMEEING